MQEQYLKNVELLEQAVRTDAAIFPIAGHKKKDGTLDIERNLKIWRQALEPFYKTLLWEGGAPGFDASKTPLQEDPYLVFFPAPESETPKGGCRRRVEALLSGVWVQENRLVSARVISRFGTNQVSAVSAAQAEGNSHLPRVFAQITSPMIIASPATNRYTAMVRFSGEMLKGSPRVIETTPFVAAQ